MNDSSDFRVEDHGSIFLLHPISTAAQEWASEHIDEAVLIRDSFIPGIIIESEFVDGFIEDLLADGLTVHTPCRNRTLTTADQQFLKAVGIARWATLN